MLLVPALSHRKLELDAEEAAPEAVEEARLPQPVNRLNQPKKPPPPSESPPAIPLNISIRPLRSDSATISARKSVNCLNIGLECFCFLYSLKIIDKVFHLSCLYFNQSDHNILIEFVYLKNFFPDLDKLIFPCFSPLHFDPLNIHINTCGSWVFNGKNL